MSILFEESKPRGTAKKAGRGRGISGLSAKRAAPAARTGLGLFADDDAKPAQTNSPKAQARDKKGSKNWSAVMQEFTESHPGLKEYMLVLPLPKSTGTVSDRHAEALELVKVAQRAMQHLMELHERLAGEATMLREKRNKKILEMRPKPYDSFEKRRRVGLVADLCKKEYERVQWSLGEFMVLTTRIDELVAMVEKDDSFDMSVKLATADIERDLTGFTKIDAMMKRLTVNIEHVTYAVKEVATPKFDYGKMISIAKVDLDEVTGFFPDTGEAQALLDLDFERKGGSMDKCVSDVLNNPCLAGKVLLAVSRDFLGDKGDRDLPVVFILFCRKLFSAMYIRSPPATIDDELGRRLNEMRRLPVMAFGINESFLPAHYMSMPIGKIPADNPYRECTDLFLAATLQVCPVDFCHAIWAAVRAIQTTASKFSYDAKIAAGKLEAKSDHLLCLDDLSDISLVVFLMSESYTIASLVKYFEPYIQGLEMTSHLEFAFTNIHAIVVHIMDLDFDKFMHDARQRTATAAEVDPLNILG